MAAAATDPRLPVIKHLYQNHVLDSTRWNFVRLRDDDIIVTTSYKAGTTWMQAIVGNLIFSGQEPPAPISELSPFLEFRPAPLELVLTGLERQRNRRFIKTHLPLDGFPFDSRLKYIHVGRDARDVFMSFWNHYRTFTDEAMLLMNLTLGRVGNPLPPCPDDVHELWHNWITRGWFEWETEGYPWWSNLHNVQSWWDYRRLENILFVHYSDLLADPEGEIRRVARFLEIDVPDAAWPAIVRNCSFAEMKAKGERFAPLGGVPFKGGAQTFFHKGTNGRWRDILSAEELALYDAAAKRELTPECREWLENGSARR
jgi:aryl sulfotransferase